MGVCASCLGRESDNELSDEDEQSRLLFDDAHTNHYGSFGEHNAGAVQADPQELQRENEALQKLVTQTSNHLVDIFAAVPQTSTPGANPTTIFPPQDARFVQYQDVLAKMPVAEGLKPSLSTDSMPVAPDGWASDDDDLEETKGYTPVKSEGIGPLLGGFADADSVMS